MQLQPHKAHLQKEGGGGGFGDGGARRFIKGSVSGFSRAHPKLYITADFCLYSQSRAASRMLFLTETPKSQVITVQLQSLQQSQVSSTDVIFTACYATELFGIILPAHNNVVCFALLCCTMQLMPNRLVMYQSLCKILQPASYNPNEFNYYAGSRFIFANIVKGFHGHNYQYCICVLIKK